MNEYIVIFLLFVAVLAAGWFYLQRAKARDAPTNEPGRSEPAEVGGRPADRPE